MCQCPLCSQTNKRRKGFDEIHVSGRSFVSCGFDFRLRRYPGLWRWISGSAATSAGRLLPGTEPGRWLPVDRWLLLPERIPVFLETGVLDASAASRGNLGCSPLRWRPVPSGPLAPLKSAKKSKRSRA